MYDKKYTKSKSSELESFKMKWYAEPVKESAFWLII